MKNMPRVILFIFVAVTVIQAACSGDNQPKDDILKQAPFAQYTDSIRLFPDNPRYYLARALMLSQKNLHDLATADYKKAWEISGDEGVALEYASNLRLINQNEDAYKLLTECKKKFPENTEFSRRLSELYAETGRKKEALNEIDQLIRVDSFDFMAWYEKGRLLARMEDTAGAIEALEISYHIQPINYTGLALSEIYSSQQNPRLLLICNDILRRDSTGEMVDALMLKGIYYSDKKEYKPALEIFEECIRRDWKFTQAYIEKGIIQFEKKEYPQALETFKLASTVSNTEADTYYWMARTYEQMNDKEQSKQNYERALSLDRSLEEAREGLQRVK